MSFFGYGCALPFAPAPAAGAMAAAMPAQHSGRAGIAGPDGFAVNQPHFPAASGTLE